MFLAMVVLPIPLLPMKTGLSGGSVCRKDRVISDLVGGWDHDVEGIGRANGMPVTAVDHSEGPHRGNIYVNWVDERNGDKDVFIITSSDQGETWSSPIRVNDDEVGNGKDQFFTWMAVDPTDGSINVAFYDRRQCEGTGTRLTLARSIDGGQSFKNFALSEQPEFECQPRAFFGDYLGIDAHQGRVAMAYMHFLDSSRLAVSCGVFDFKPGTLESAQ